MKILNTILILIILCSCSREKAEAPAATQVELEVKFVVKKAILTWTHPRLKESKVDVIENTAEASRLLAAFDGLMEESSGSAYDTPFYDLSVEFFTDDGKSVTTKVYLPRKLTFPGMWKHPQSGSLYYFDDANGESETLVEVLRPYLPSVYPSEFDRSKGVQFIRGIPDFREQELPIDGKFPPGTFE